MSTWREAFSQLADACSTAGLDLAQPLQVGWYNRAVAFEHRLPDFGSPSSLAILIGNTRALWPLFVEALRTRPELALAADPLDRYVVDAVERAAASLPRQREVRFSHEPPPRRVAIQRLAQVSGLAFLSPARLALHVVHGPWISLRAVVVLDLPGPDHSPPEPATPCTTCARPCEAALARALSLPGQEQSVEARWQEWLAVRDACPVGVESRFQPDHIRYGYTKDREILRRLTTRPLSP